MMILLAFVLFPSSSRPKSMIQFFGTICNAKSIQILVLVDASKCIALVILLLILTCTIRGFEDSHEMNWSLRCIGMELLPLTVIFLLWKGPFNPLFGRLTAVTVIAAAITLTFSQ
jgi:hypothetical protein